MNMWIEYCCQEVVKRKSTPLRPKRPLIMSELWYNVLSKGKAVLYQRASRSGFRQGCHQEIWRHNAKSWLLNWLLNSKQIFIKIVIVALLFNWGEKLGFRSAETTFLAIIFILLISLWAEDLQIQWDSSEIWISNDKLSLWHFVVISGLWVLLLIVRI